MAFPPKWALTGLGWAKRAWEKLESVPWHPWISWPLLAAVAAFVLWNGSVCDPRSDDPLPAPTEVERVPVEVVQRIAENMAETRLSWLDRHVRGLESRPPERIVLTDTVLAEPADVCMPSVVIKDRSLSRPVYSRVTTGWEVKLIEDVDVTGCDGLRVVGDQVICDTPVLGKWSIVAGTALSAPHSVFRETENLGVDAYAGLGWQRHRDSRLSVAALYGVDQTVRLRAEWRVNLW